MKKLALLLLALPLAACAVATPDLPVRPIVSSRTMPPYPTISRQSGEQGTSRLLLSIDANGRITDCRITRSSSERLDAAACFYVHGHWRYQPATRNGKPIASSDSVELVWVLGSDSAVLKH